MSEATITAAVKRQLLRDGWFVIKLFGGRMQMSGLPDLLCLRNGVYLWLEIKTPGNGLSPRQRWVHDLLRTYGAEIHVVKSLKDLGEIPCIRNATTSTPSDSTQSQDSASSSAPSSTTS